MSGLIYFIILLVVVRVITNATKNKTRTGQTNKVEQQKRLKEAYEAQMRQRQSRQTVGSQRWDSSWEEDDEYPQSEGTYFEGAAIEELDDEPPQDQSALTSWEDVVRRYVEPTKVKPRTMKLSQQVKPIISTEGGSFGQGQSSYEGTPYGEGESSLEGDFGSESSPYQKTGTVVGRQTPALTTRDQVTNPWELVNLVEKNNLLNGIILSEILGPPKAKIMNRVMNEK